MISSRRLAESPAASSRPAGSFPLTQLRLRLASSPSLRNPLPLKKGEREPNTGRVIQPFSVISVCSVVNILDAPDKFVLRPAKPVRWAGA